MTQGKLAMGYRCSSDDYPAMVLANLIFGGTSNSKLFLNVRERLSLCYYASSSYARSKNILTVSSGVETADFERAEAEIGRQLQAVQQGDWEDWEQEGALHAIRASLLSLSDSQGALENFYLGQIAAGVEETPEELAAALDQIGARGFNMECIKSRPLPHVPFEYYFYVQIVCPAGSTGAGCQTLLDTLTSVCSTLRLLGAFTLDSTEK